MAWKLSCGDAAQPYIRAAADNERWYAACGTRLYSVATLAGQFPDMGLHQPHEMGGVWAPPLKLLDGYWLGLRTRGQATYWLTTPTTWEMAPDGITFSYALPTLELRVSRREWVVPNESALVVEVAISRHYAARWKKSLALTCSLAVRSDLHGAWLAEERLGWRDGDDLAIYDETLGAVILRDSLHPSWEACVGATQMPDAWEVGKDVWGPERTSGRGTGAILWYRGQVTAEEPVRWRFLITGAASEAVPATAAFVRLARPALRRASRSKGVNADALDTCSLEQAQCGARETFRAPFTRCVLRSPDPQIDQVFAWAKAWASMLMLDVPGLGRAAMAGLPEFPWWFGCDLAYGVLPMLPTGQADEARSSLRTLAKISQRNAGTGAVAHELVSHGLVAHPGNLVETPLFARALYHAYRWTGDRALLEELFPFCVQGIEQWALGACLEPGEQAPRGSSIVETPEMATNLQALDVAAYLVEALDLLSALASDLQRGDLAARLRERADRLRQHLREDWWLPEEHLFGDVRASRAELQALLKRLESLPGPEPSQLTSIQVLRRALAQDAPASTGLHMRRPWLLFHMVQALAADAGLPSRDQAAALLDRLETPEWVEQHGIVLNAVTNRRVMSLPTGALAVGQARYGHADQALQTIQRMAAAFGAGMPGALSEYTPDGIDGADIGCFLQLWSNYGIIWPVVHYFFGLRPDVANKRLMCAPQMPAGWPAASLSALPIGDMQAQIDVSALPGGLRVHLETTAPDWEVTLGAALPGGVHVTSAVLNGDPVAFRPVQLTEYEGRETWLAPAMRGRASYELRVSWLGSAQSSST
jgi:hypothetical protein